MTRVAKVVVPGLMGFIGLYASKTTWRTRKPLWQGAATCAGGQQGGGLVCGAHRKDDAPRAHRRAAASSAPAPFQDAVQPGGGRDRPRLQDGRGLAAHRRNAGADRVRLLENIVCAQPFGCLPNHIVRQGHDPHAFATCIPRRTSCPSITTQALRSVNQENRIKLMLAVAREREAKARGASASEAEEAAVAAQ